MLISSLYSSSCFNIIRRIDHNHARDCTHQRDIFVALMSSTVFTNRDTGMSSTNLHIQMRIADTVSDLFKSTACCKHCKRTCKRHFAGCSKTSCDTHHIALSNTTVDMSFRKFLLKNTCLGCFSKVSIQNDNLFMFLAKLYQSMTIAFSCSDFLYF